MRDDFPDWTCGRTLPGRSAMPHATSSRTRPVKRSRKAGPGNYSPRGTSDPQLIAVLAYREKSHRLRRQHRKNHHHRPSFTGLIPTAPPRVTTKRHATPPTATPQNNPATTRSHPASRPHNTLGHASRQTPAFPPRPNRVARQACPPIRQSGARSGHQPPCGLATTSARHWRNGNCSDSEPASAVRPAPVKSRCRANNQTR
jgi:hypothetical protein